MRDAVAVLRRQVEAALADNRRGERLRDGLRIVIAGRPNVGKSSLLNALARRNAAIVSETAGTTRDVIEVHMDLDGFPVSLIDTAGLREAGDDIEREGIVRARVRLEDADVVLWVTDAGDRAMGVPREIDRSRMIWTVLNKCDLEAVPLDTESGSEPAEHFYRISARTGDGLAMLVSALSAMAAELLSGGESVVVTRARHRAALEDCQRHVTAALDQWGGEPELVAEDLRLAARALGRITGRVDVEDLLDVIFRDFCIGK